MKTALVHAIALLCIGLSLVESYPQGAPVDTHPEICEHMFPTGHNETAQNSEAPFEITLSEYCYKKGDKITVTLRTTTPIADDDYFEGLFILARNAMPGSTEIIGEFQTDDPDLKTVNCGSGWNNALTQADKAHYFEKSFYWMPGHTDKTVVFVATVVHETEDFWLDVRSDHLAMCAMPSSANINMMPGFFLAVAYMVSLFL